MATKPSKLQRTYNVPLRREWLKVPRYKRAKKAVKALREFLQKHMKCDNVILGKHVNEEIWKKGIKNPPHHVKVDTMKDDDKVVAEISGKPLPKLKKEEEKKGLAAKALEKIKGKPKEEKPEEVKQEQKEAAKKQEAKKEIIKKEEAPKQKAKQESKKEVKKEASQKAEQIEKEAN